MFELRSNSAPHRQASAVVVVLQNTLSQTRMPQRSNGVNGPAYCGLKCLFVMIAREVGDAQRAKTVNVKSIVEIMSARAVKR